METAELLEVVSWKVVSLPSPVAVDGDVNSQEDRECEPSREGDLSSEAADFSSLGLHFIFFFSSGNNTNLQGPPRRVFEALHTQKVAGTQRTYFISYSLFIQTIM